MARAVPVPPSPGDLGARLRGDRPAASLTVGIDLAAQDRETAVCCVDWSAGRPRVVRLELAPTHDELLALLGRGAVVGIDAPFGWPGSFVRALASWQDGFTWPDDPWATPAGDARSGSAGADARRRRTAGLRLRATDRIVHRITGGPPPLSVSTDRIAIVAMRCAALLAAASARRSPEERIDRLGAGAVLEVYPAATLRQWALRSPLGPSGRIVAYKGPGAADARRAILDAVEAAVGLDLGPARSALVASDHALDALLCALSARAAVVTGAALPPPAAGARRLVRTAADRETAAVDVSDLDLSPATLAGEGWIWIPQPADGTRWSWA